MKIIYIAYLNGFDALTFEEKYLPNLEIWEFLKEFGYLKKDKDDMDILEGEALEFEDVDPNFIDFIKDKFIDYDLSKDTNFYVVEE